MPSSFDIKAGNLRVVMTHQFPLDAPGGGTRSCVQIARQLRKLGVDVILISISDDCTPPMLENEFSEIFTVPVNRFHYLLSGLSVRKIIQKLIYEKKIDAVIGWEYETAFIPHLLKAARIVFGMISAKPSIAEWINRKTKFPLLSKIVDGWFRWRLYESADVVYVASEFTRGELTSLLNVNSSHIVNTRRGIKSIFSQVARESPSKISNFIFYGSLAPNKGVFDAIEALGKVASQGHQAWQLRVAGFGDEEAFRQAVKKHGIEDRVLFLGCLKSDELVRELKWADLAILPSRSESFGRAIAEAQASGLAVVSYIAGSVPEIVEDGVTGWLVKAQNTSLLAAAIIEAIQDPSKTYQMGLEGRFRAIQRFSWEKTTEAILQGIEIAKHNHTFN